MIETSREPRGYCPSVWAPMPSGDGLIVRVRPRHSRLSASALGALARLARARGNGVIELTRRANLQLRGVSPGSWPGLRDALVELGLAEADAGAEARPGLFVCPLSGLDPRCPPLEPLAGRLLEVLAGAPSAQLPDKFALVLSGGSQLSSALTADVHVRLHPDHPGLAELLLGGKVADAISLGLFATRDLPGALAGLLTALAESPIERRRMRDAVAADLPRLGRAVDAARVGPPRREPAWGSPEVGYHTGSVDWFGYALPFGSANASAWGALARLAARLGSGEVRLTPTRHVLVVGVRPGQRAGLAAFGERRAFGVRHEPRALDLVACSGAPACSSAHGETRELARRLGERIGAPLRPSTLHVSGCEKSCARDGEADVTLVQAPDGLRLGFGRDVRGTLLSRPLSLDAVHEQLDLRFAHAGGARRGGAERAGADALPLAPSAEP